MPSCSTSASVSQAASCRSFTLFRQRIACQLGHLGEVRLLNISSPDALRQIIFLTPGFLYLVVEGIVAQVLAAGIVTANWIKQVFAQWHGGQEVAWLALISSFPDLQEGHLFIIDKEHFLSERRPPDPGRLPPIQWPVPSEHYRRRASSSAEKARELTLLRVPCP